MIPLPLHSQTQHCKRSKKKGLFADRAFRSQPRKSEEQQMKCGGHQEQYLPLPEGSKVPRGLESFTTSENPRERKAGGGRAFLSEPGMVMSLKLHQQDLTFQGTMGEGEDRPVVLLRDPGWTPRTKGTGPQSIHHGRTHQSRAM